MPDDSWIRRLIIESEYDGPVAIFLQSFVDISTKSSGSITLDTKPSQCASCAFIASPVY